MTMSLDIPVWGQARVVGLLAVLIIAGLLGSRWISRVPIENVEVVGAVVSDPEEIITLAEIPLDTTLFALNARLVADRAARHPWVESASVRRMPSGELKIAVRERTPVALMIGDDGYPTEYVDASGFRMPFKVGFQFQVPLIIGVDEPFHPMGAIQHPTLVRLLRDLANLDPNLDALTSEWKLQRDGTVLLVTVPAPSGKAISVRMGDREFAKRLSRLRAYWSQSVLPRPEIQYEWIDLRFKNQIVTRELS